MTHKVTVRFGGAADSEVHDYSDRIRLLGDGSPLISGGMACDNGTAGMGQLILDDEDNDIPHRTDPPGLQLAAHNQIIWSEDSPGYESWLSIGRIDNKSVGRPHTYTAGVNRQWTVQWADANIDFDGLTLTEDWVRPAETDVDRVLAAVAAFCNGSPRLTTVFQTHLVSSAGAVTMPAKTYPAGTELPELFDDCASVAGKVYSVVIHDQDSASHTCLLHIDEEDHTTYPCTLSISDQLDEVDGETVFEPVWRQGGATEEQGQELITGLVSRYGLDTTATAVVTDSDHADAYDYWVKPYNDDLAATATEATNRATAMVHARWNEHVTHQPSILIPARLHHLLKAGMSINIKSAAAMGGQYLGTVQTRRIANIEWSHAGWRGTDAMLWANLQLDRTPRKLPLSSGTKPGPKPPTAGSAPGVITSADKHWGDFTSPQLGMVIPATDQGAVYLAVLMDSETGGSFPDVLNGVTWLPSYPSTADQQTLTLIDSVTHPIPANGTDNDGNRLYLFRLLDPTPTTAGHESGGGQSRFTVDASGFELGWAVGAWVVDGVDQSNPDDAPVSNTGTSSSSSITASAGSGQLLLNVAGWRTHNSASVATPVAGGGQTTDQATVDSEPFGQVDNALGMGHGGTNPTWNWSAAHNWVAMAINVNGVAGDDPPPAADDGTGSIGTPGDGCYATCDHKHPVQTAAVTPITDTAGNFTATNVEDALAELADDVAGATGAPDVTAAGSGTSLITTGGYVSFPLFAYAANGDLLLFYRRGTDHNATLDGVIYLRTSTDDGATFGSEATVFDHASLSVGPSEVVVRRNGDIIVSYCTQDGFTVTDNFIGYTITSTDDAATWGTPVATGTTYGTGSNHREVPVGIVELPDDRLLMAFFVRTSAATKDKIVSFISDDDGATWGDEATIVSDADSWSECRLEILDDGTILAMLRNDTDKDLYISKATVPDGGSATWSTPTLAFSGWGFPRFRQLNSGAIGIIYRQDNGTSDGRAVYRISYDRGATWSAEANLETSGLDMQYADLIGVPRSTTVRAVYSIENSSTDADLYVTTLTDIADVRYSLGAESAVLALDDLSDVTLSSPSDDQVLTYDSTTGKWVNQNSSAGFSDPTTTKGDLIVHGASTTRLAVGTNGQVLTADSTQATGVKWATNSGGSGLVIAANLPRDVGTMEPAAITGTNVSVGIANRAYFLPFVPKVDETVSTAYFRVATQSGNMDIGIYDASLTKLTSTGSFAVPAAANASRALSASQALSAGSLYYIGFAVDNVTAKFYGMSPTGVSAVATGRTATSSSGAFAYLNSGFALPAGPVTPTGYDPSALIPAVFLA